MRAVVIPNYGGLDMLHLKDIPVPTPTAEQVLIRVQYVGLNFADVSTRRGDYGRREVPLVPGLEVAGVVESVGEQVNNIKPGMCVVALTDGGGYAEYALANQTVVFPLQSDIPLDVAAATLLQGLTAYELLMNVACVTLSNSILVHAGSGGVGGLLIQLARILKIGGVYATASTIEKKKYALKLGAHGVWGYEDYNEEILKTTNGTGVDIIFNAVGGDLTDQDLSCLATNGKIVIYGAASGRGWMLDPRALMPKSQSVVGYSVNRLRNQPKEFFNTAEKVFELVGQGRLQIHIDGQYPLEDAQKAHGKLESRDSIGKLLLYTRK